MWSPPEFVFLLFVACRGLAVSSYGGGEPIPTTVRKLVLVQCLWSKEMYSGAFGERWQNIGENVAGKPSFWKASVLPMILNSDEMDEKVHFHLFTTDEANFSCSESEADWVREIQDFNEKVAQLPFQSKSVQEKPKMAAMGLKKTTFQLKMHLFSVPQCFFLSWYAQSRYVLTNHWLYKILYLVSPCHSFFSAPKIFSFR